MKKIILACIVMGLTYTAEAQSKKNPGRTREANEVDMKGTNPKKNSYSQDTAILNNANMPARQQPVKDVDMMGTDPKHNSYAEDTAILNDVNMNRKKK